MMNMKLLEVVTPPSIYHISIKQSVKELTFLSYFLFSHNSSNICASTPFRRLPYALASNSWYGRHVRDLALELFKEKNTDSSAVVDSKQIHNYSPQPQLNSSHGKLLSSHRSEWIGEVNASTHTWREASCHPILICTCPRS